MPDSGAGLSRGARFDTFLWQLPTLLSVAFLAIGIAIAEPGWLAAPGMQGGFALLAVASLLALLADHVGEVVRLAILVPVADLVALGLVRAEVLPQVTTAGLLVAFPIVWLAFQFGWVGLVAAVLGAAFVSGYPFLRDADPPQTGVQWLQFTVLPFVAVFLGVVVRIAARALARSRRALLERSAALADALRRAEDNVVLGEGILQTIDAAVAFFDAEGTLRMSNEQAHVLAEKGGADLAAGRIVGDQVWADDQRTPIPPEHQIVPRAIRGESPRGRRVTWVGPPGDQIAVVSSARQLRRDDGEPLGTVVAAWDVTELVELTRVREEFLATVSHELRTPLTSILGYAEVLDEALADEERLDLPQVRRLVGIIQRNADTLLARISQLLSASERGIAVQPRDVDLGALVEDAVVRHLPAASAAGVYVEQVRGRDVRARVDPMRLEQVLDNLLSNAIKYTPDGGRVTVGVDRDEAGRVVLTVADTGIGMSPAEQRQAFEKFYRAEGARRSATQGIGVGLAVVSEVVEAHRGQVRLDSRPGAGTTVRIVLPAT